MPTSPRRTRRRGTPKPPSAREVAKPKVLPEGEKKGRRADVGIRPYTRSIDGRFVGGDAYIAPYAAAAPWHQPKGTFRAPARGTFDPGGKSTQKRRSNLRFENPLRAYTCRLSCSLLPREHCAMQISPKSCIVSASLFTAALALKCEAAQSYVSTRKYYQTAALGRHLPLPQSGKGAI